MGYENERIGNAVQSNDSQLTSKDNDTQSVINSTVTDCAEDKLDKSGQRGADENDQAEESVETEEVVTYTDSSTFLKVLILSF